MIRTTEAVASEGVLKRVEDLGLREGQRVFAWIVELLSGSLEDRAAVFAKLKTVLVPRPAGRAIGFGLGIGSR